MQDLVSQLKQYKYQVFLAAGFIALGAVLVYLVKQPIAQPQTKAETLVEVVLQPTELKLSVNETAALEVKLLPKANKTVSLDAVDVFLIFDSEKLEIEKIEKTDLFPTYPLLTHQNGVIKVSGLAWGENGVQKASLNKESLLATIHLKAKAVGESKIGLSKDSVAAQNGENVLDLNKLSKTIVEIK